MDLKKKKMKEEIIRPIRMYDMPDTVMIPDGYDVKEVPEATRENILVLMHKINDLVTEINELKEKL